MPAPTAICPICARPISPSAPKGLCPVCLAASLAELFVEAAGENAEPKPALAAPNERLGDYELLDELGRGGMGVVFRARDWRLNRVVALKLILTGELASQAEVKRFHNEAEAAAQLEHPNIVPIYEIGESEGRHFFAMKLVEGGSLAGKLISGQYLASSNQSRPADGGALNTDSLNSDFSPQTSTALVAKVARAVHHAHRRGILHRDLKPGNILLDAVGEPMVADFGLARRVDNASGMTLSGAVVGSPSYMAPEQAAGGSRDVTVAADIYSLGAIFYELLAGRPPFDGATPMEVMRKVIEDEPQPPSRSGKRVINHQFSVTGEQWDARHPKTDDWLLDTEHSYRVDGDLQTICLKCLRKDPRQRYVSAEALAEDLERWQRHEPILARPSSLWEQTAKWVRRRPALAGLLGVSAAALLGFIAMQFANEAKLTHERDRATTNEVYALAEARLAASNALNARLNLYAADMFLVGRALDEGNLALARRTLARHMPRAGEVDLRGFEWRYFREQARGAQFQTFTNFTDAIFSVAFSPDGRGLAAAGANLVQWFNATNLQLLATLTHDSTVHSVCFSADGATLWTGDSRGQGRAWSESGGALTSLIHRGTGYVHVAAPSGAVNYVAFGDRDYSGPKGWGEAALYNSADALAPNARGRTFTNAGGLAAFSRDGQWLLTGGGNAPATLRNLLSGETKPGICRNMQTLALALSPGADTMAISAYNGYALVLYNVAEARLIWPNMGFSGCVHGLAFSPDGQTLALACSDHMIRLCSAATGRTLRRLAGHMAEVFTVAFSPDGQTLVSGGVDRTVRLWRLGTNAAPDTFSRVFRPLAFSPDSLTLTAATGPVWPLGFVNYHLATLQRQPGPELPSWAHEYPMAWRAKNSGSLGWVLGGGASDYSAQFKEFMGACTNDTGAICVSGGNGIVLGRSDGVVLGWNTASGARLPDFRIGGGAVQRLAISGDGRVAAAAGVSNMVAVWDTTTGASRFRLPAHEYGISALALSLDGRVLAVGLGDPTSPSAERSQSQ